MSRVCVGVHFSAVYSESRRSYRVFPGAGHMPYRGPRYSLGSKENDHNVYLNLFRKGRVMRLRERVAPVVASVGERAAVAELMTLGETPFGRPLIKITRPVCIPVVLVSAGEPVDDPDEE